MKKRILHAITLHCLIGGKKEIFLNAIIHKLLYFLFTLNIILHFKRIAVKNNRTITIFTPKIHGYPFVTRLDLCLDKTR